MVGSGLVGDTNGDTVGPEVVGDPEVDAVGSEVVGEAVGEHVMRSTPPQIFY